MIVDFAQLQQDVTEMKALLQNLTNRLATSGDIPSPDEVLTIQQAAALLKVTTATVYDLVHRRAIPFSKPGKRLYFSKNDLTSWLHNHRRPTAAEQVTAYESSRLTSTARRGGRKTA